MPELVLASVSPRRKALLQQVCIPFRVIPPTALELTPQNGNFRETAIHNAEAKARSVLTSAPGSWILGADTMVDLEGEALGKPQHPAQAREMLMRLSGREHRVFTGLALMTPPYESARLACESTTVKFRRLRDWEIDDYIASGEPFDKAGSYGIQERGALFIERIEGCFFNVMGLPLARLWEMLREAAGVETGAFNKM